MFNGREEEEKVYLYSAAVSRSESPEETYRRRGQKEAPRRDDDYEIERTGTFSVTVDV